MKLSSKLLAAMLALISMVWTSSAYGKDVLETVYTFGFSASFNDSTVYFTDIQPLNTQVDGKTHFLKDRDQYAYQLRDYFANQGQAHRTCFIAFATTRKAIEKKYLKLRNRYTKNKHYNVKYVDSNAFSFKPIGKEE